MHIVHKISAYRRSASGTSTGHESFRCLYEGEELCVSTKPLYDCARILHARGLAGNLQMVNPDGVFSLSGDIGKMALLTISENKKTGPRVVKYVPFVFGSEIEKQMETADF